jgi:pimeloyl-ACP methyl ester carboxylesterase
MPLARTNGTELFYQQLGSGPDVVLLHGLAANHAFWFATVVMALRRHHRVTVYDLRGHGRSAMPATGYTSDEMSRDLRGLMDYLCIGSAVLIGHSFGGHVALQFAIDHPERVRALTLVDTRLYALQPVQRLDDSSHQTAFEKAIMRRGAIDTENEAHIGLRFLEECAAQQGEEAPESGDNRLVPEAGAFVPFRQGGGSARAAGKWLKLLSTTTARDDIRSPAGLTQDKIQRVSVPVLSVYGELSRCMPSGRALQRLLPESKLLVVPRAGHFFPLSRPGFFLGALAAFLEATNCAAAGSA